jgi:hypothetical protein
MDCLCRSADFEVGCLAGFKTRVPFAGSTRSKLRHPADLEIGDTAGSETCATAVSADCMAPTSKSAVSRVSQSILKGLCHSAQGWPDSGRAYLGSAALCISTIKGLYTND